MPIIEVSGVRQWYLTGTPVFSTIYNCSVMTPPKYGRKSDENRNSKKVSMSVPSHWPLTYQASPQPALISLLSVETILKTIQLPSEEKQVIILCWRFLDFILP